MHPLLAQATPPAGLNGWQIVGGVLLLLVGEVVRRALNAQEKKHEDHDKRHESDVAALQKARDEHAKALQDARDEFAEALERLRAALADELRQTRHDLANRITANELNVATLERDVEHLTERIDRSEK